MKRSIRRIQTPAGAGVSPVVVGIENLIIAAAYVLGARVGFFLAFFNSQVSPVWPPEGIALAGILIWGWRVVPGILFGAFAANFLNNPHLETAVLIALGNTAGAAVNGWIILRWVGADRLLSSTRGLVILLAGIVPGSALSALTGVTSLWTFGRVNTPDYPGVLLTWFSGELEGFLIVAPLLVTWAGILKEKWEPRRIMAGAGLLLMLCLATYLSFSRNLPIFYIPIPFIVLSALRFGKFGATLGVALLSGIAVFHTISGRGPFAVFSEGGNLSLNNTLILLDAYIFVVTAIAYVLVAVAEERQAAMLESMAHLIEVEKIKDQANRELEAKVIERTRIIATQKQELEDQIAVAEKIQMSLLPSLPEEIPGCQIAFRYQPMMKIGGDFVDIRHDPRTNSLGMFICDVNGHGVPAAFLAAMVKMSLSDWYGHLADLRGAISHLHGSLRDKLGENFITICMAHLDLRTGLLGVIRAGHHPLLILRKSGEVETVNPRGRMLMADALPTSEPEEVQLYVGDRVLLYTDGLTEARNPKGELIFSEETLAAAAADRSLSVPRVCSAIFDRVLSGSGGMDFLEDDITFLVAEFTGPSGR